MNKKLKKLFFKGAEFLGVKYPIMGGAMTWISESNLFLQRVMLGGLE